MTSLDVENVSVDFPVFTGGRSVIQRTALMIRPGDRITRETGRRVNVHALRNVSFQLSDGDRVGLVGGNGAGKTTLLRVLAGVYEPTRGAVRRRGQITPLLNATLGIEAEATGYENILLRGLVLGMNKEEIRSKVDEIAEFTELGEYLDMPVRTYSSGMRVRLSLAVTACVNPEILLMDEWIGMGDAHFLKKAEHRLTQMVDRANILVLASHSAGLLTDVCNKAIWLDGGMVKEIGAVDQVFQKYLDSSPDRGKVRQKRVSARRRQEQSVE